MMRRWSSLLCGGLAVVATAAILVIGPPAAAPPTARVLDQATLTAWCRANVGAGGAVWYQDRWQCSHAVAGFFVLTPLPADVVCGPPGRPATIEQRPDGLTCA